MVDELASDEAYTYLGVEQLLRTKSEATKRRIRMKYMHRLHRVWGSDLAAGGTQRLGRPYFFALEWSRENSKELDRWTRKALGRYQAHHAEASIDRLYILYTCPLQKEAGASEAWSSHGKGNSWQWRDYLRSSRDQQVQGAVKTPEAMIAQGSWEQLTG